MKFMPVLVGSSHCAIDGILNQIPAFPLAQTGNLSLLFARWSMSTREIDFECRGWLSVSSSLRIKPISLRLTNTISKSMYQECIPFSYILKFFNVL